MECSSCGYANPEGARFCGECGAPLATDIVCSECGASNAAQQRFCNACGQALRPDAAPAEPLEPVTSVLEAEGERKQVSVLFADVKGSMDLAGSFDPEDWRRIMERFVAILCDGVRRFEGTVDKFTGDGIMAIFGAPVAHEDHARRACYAALHLTGELARYAAELRRSEGLNFSVRMGINSGEVVVGAIGDGTTLDYTAIGHTVGLAQRMEALAEPGKAYVTEHTARLVEGYFRLADLGEFGIKGVRDPVRVYELAGVGALRTRLDVAAARGFSRFVGRDDEMAALESSLARSVEGDGQVVGVVADAGVGKSRLCFEFAERCRARGIEVWEAHALAHGRTVPFLPVLEILRDYFGIAEGDDDRTAREKVAGRLLLLDEAFAEVLPLMFEFLGVPDPDRPAPRIDPEARQRHLFAALNRLLRARSDESPGVVIVEDLHWLDPGSAAFLENLVTHVPGTRTLVLVNFRPEYHADWMHLSYYRQVPLAPLGAAATEELLRDLLGADPSLDGLAELVRERTGGNPFFVEEVVQGLAESGTLLGSRGAYRLAQTIAEVSIPATVQSVLAARIDRLPEREKALLQTAAVIGRQFTEPVLRRVAGLPEPAFDSALHALVASEFVFEVALYPEAEYAFKHALTEEVAYRSRLGESRARVHRKVAEAIAESEPDRLDEHAALIAHHWERAGATLEAAQWSARAAGWAGLNDPAEALRHWRRVQAFADALPPGAEAEGLALGARAMIVNFAWRLGLPEGQDVDEFEREMATVYREARELAERAGNLSVLATLVGTYGALRLVTGHLEDAVALGREADELAGRVGDLGLRLSVQPTTIYALFVLGRYREMLAACDAALEMADGDRSLGAGLALGSPYAWVVMMRGLAMAHVGRLEEAWETLGDALRFAREAGDLETEGWTQMQFCGTADFMGDGARALAHARQAFELAERTGGAFSVSFAHLFLGRAHAVRGEWDDAEAAAERALAMFRERHTGVEAEGWGLITAAEARLGRGDAAGALRRATEGVAVTRALGIRGYGIQAAVVASRARLALGGPGDVDRAERDLRELAPVAEELGGLVFIPPIQAALAEAARLRGDHLEADRLLQTAHRGFVETGAHGRAAELALTVG